MNPETKSTFETLDLHKLIPFHYDCGSRVLDLRPRSFRRTKCAIEQELTSNDEHVPFMYLENRVDQKKTGRPWSAKALVNLEILAHLNMGNLEVSPPTLPLLAKTPQSEYLLRPPSDSDRVL